MEFHEKLQELRKARGLTQEELAEALFVSRTAVSKWESGRGCPNIESLKQIASFYSVSIDDLLSGDKLIVLAEQENQKRLNGICSLLLGVIDLFSVFLIILPLYGNQSEGIITPVTLFSYSDTAALNRTVFWVLSLSLILTGMMKVYCSLTGKESAKKPLTVMSILVGIISVLYYGIAREPYALFVSFSLLAVKTFLLFESVRKTGAGS